MVLLFASMTSGEDRRVGERRQPADGRRQLTLDLRARFDIAPSREIIEDST
jgi:hypothetical protein